ncbi:type 1 fimbrial protein [Salmonella enterica]|nr:type 1 fimbrial protein [Salmonella enterica]EEI9370423.1 type 1 fimbrial protein [Salmonella enterica subsp. enterica serovar Chester]EDS8694764.1 type 1 fimbrial protein [Salmonella enterica]EHM4967840.1 type 1 fimbrial protein [Salmonella enterica]EIW6867283.1 type 1 fimbrial protein [Salmonella enterica]
MKKSTAGQGAAGALLLAGLMMSAGAMAASGDPVQGGSGSVTINVPIVTSTCSVAVPTEVNFDPVNTNSIDPPRIVAMKDFNITLSNCSGKTLQLSTRAHEVYPDQHIKGNFSSGDPDHVLGYLISYPNVPEITGGYPRVISLMYLDNTNPLTIKPNSDTYLMASNIYLQSLVKNPSNLGTTVSGGFDYTFTYQ